MTRGFRLRYDNAPLDPVSSRVTAIGNKAKEEDLLSRSRSCIRPVTRGSKLFISAKTLEKYDGASGTHLLRVEKNMLKRT
jgi:hypothetical protein